MREAVILSWSAALALVLAVGCGDDQGSGAETTAASGSTGDAEAGTDASTGGSTGTPPESPEDVLFADRVINIAHAGGKGTRPEHTMVAYEQARIDGADVLELDIHATSDGVLVLMHDETVARTTDGTGAIGDLTFAELRELDAGFTFTTDDGATYPFRGMGLVVPSLEEVFDAHPDIAYVIEIKQAEPSIVDPFIALCRDRGIADQMVASAFSQEILVEIRGKAPDIPTNLAVPEVIELLGVTPETEADYVPPGQFVQVPIEQSGLTILSPRLIELAATFDLQVHAWTINDAAQMQIVLDMGVDGVITDFPDRLRDLL